MKSTVLFALAAFTLLSFPATAQKQKLTEMEKVEKLRPKKKIKVGNNLYDRGSFYNAIEVYEMVLVKKPNHTDTWYKLGMTNYMIRDYAKAAEWFQQIAEFDSLGFPLSQYYLGASLKRTAEYEKAKTAFSNFKKTKFKRENDEIRNYKSLVEKEIEGCDFGLKTMAQEKIKVRVEHLDAGINAPMSDYAPRQFNDKLIFSSLKSDTVIVIDPEFENAVRYSRLYESVKGGSGWSAGELAKFPFNTGDIHVGNGMYAPDGKSFVFTKCEETENLGMKCQIYVSTNTSGTWSEPVLLGNGINMDDATATHPFITSNAENQEILYFSSNRQGGKGGMDIWYSTKNKNGEFGAPVNAGGIINTSGNEITPFFDMKDKKLYFSSDGYVNMGGYDIYVSEIQNKDFTTPINLGYPFNSSVDDLYFAYGENAKKGFLVSNRPGGFSLKSPTCCDDILAYYYPAEFVTVEGKLIDEETGQLVKDECFVYVYNTANDSLVGTFPSAADGTFNFKLKADEQYKIVANCKKYHENEAAIDARNMDDGAVINTEIRLKKKDLYDGKVLGIAYFDYMKFNLRNASKATMDTLAALLNSRDDLIIRIEGHTDQRGTDEYNQKLSDNRAETAYKYLLSRKVARHKLIWVGFGKTKPLEDCFQYNECPKAGPPDCPCHQNNRRTEFILFQQVSDSSIKN